jgi:hypothetical protein
LGGAGCGRQGSVLCATLRLLPPRCLPVKSNNPNSFAPVDRLVALVGERRRRSLSDILLCALPSTAGCRTSAEEAPRAAQKCPRTAIARTRSELQTVTQGPGGQRRGGPERHYRT